MAACGRQLELTTSLVSPDLTSQWEVALGQTHCGRSLPPLPRSKIFTWTFSPQSFVTVQVILAGGAVVVSSGYISSNSSHARSRDPWLNQKRLPLVQYTASTVPS